MNIKLYRSPYWNLIDYEQPKKVNLFLVKVLFYIYFFVAKDYMKESKYVEINSIEDRDLANYFCGLLTRKFKKEFNIAFRDETFGISYIPGCGEIYDKGLNGEPFGNKLIDISFKYFRR